jgi:hypothetical protein
MARRPCRRLPTVDRRRQAGLGLEARQGAVRYWPTGATDVDAHNLALARAIQQDGRVYLAPATVDGRVYLRVCFTNFRTTAEDVVEVLTVARELGDRLAATR